MNGDTPSLVTSSNFLPNVGLAAGTLQQKQHWPPHPISPEQLLSSTSATSLLGYVPRLVK